MGDRAMETIGGIELSLSAVIESIEREMFDRATKRNCGNCKWADSEVCCNGDSVQVGNFTSKDFLCNFHEFKENKNDE